MKKKQYLLKILFLLATLLAKPLAQKCYAQYYTFTQESTPYTPITNADFTVSDSAYINNNVAIMHSTYPNLLFTAFGERLTGTLEAGINGYVVAQGDDYDFVFDPFFTELRSDGTSKFQAREIKVGVDSVLEMEWVDFRVEGHPDTDYINMIARMNLTSEIIEFHYGPSSFSITPTFTPSTTLLHMTKGFVSPIESLWLTGDPLSPTITNSFGSLNEFPPNGTLYRFTGKRISTGITDKNLNKEAISIFPNPVNDQLTIDTDNRLLENITITDVSGNVNRFQENLQTIQKVDVSYLSPGVYFIKSQFTDGAQQITKFIKN